MLKSIRNETLKTLGISAGLIVAIAASGAFLVAHAAPGPGVSAAQSDNSFASLAAKAGAATATFAAHCSEDLSVDLRPDPKWVGQSFANDDCWAPALPPFIDGFAASDQKINATAAGLKTYTAQAHAYQKCIANFIAAKEGAAQKAGRPLDKTLIIVENHRIAASQADVKKVATEVEIAVDQFNQNGSDCTDGGDITFKNDAPNADGASDADNDLDVPG
jgi:hypothetical protein